MSFFRIFQHLLPTGRAWRTTVTKTLRSFFEGLASWPDDAKTYIDGVWSALMPADTDNLVDWQTQFGLSATGTTSDQRTALAAAWSAQGGQDPAYLQTVLRAAGFDVYVHEWWSSGPPYIARNPLDYTSQPLIGTVQCSALSDQPECQDSDISDQPECNAFLVNDVHYLVNKTLTDVAPPPIPTDPAKWRHFIYIGGVTLGTYARIDLADRTVLEALILKLAPAEKWIVTMFCSSSLKAISYVGASLQYVTMGDQPELDFERTDPFSVSFWAKWSGASFMLFVSKIKTSSADTGWYVQTNSGKIGVVLADAFAIGSHWIGAETAAAFNDDSWHHVVMTYDGSVTNVGFQFYVDGSAVTTNASGYSISGTTKNTGSFILGGRISTLGSLELAYTGEMLDDGVYNAELSADDVTAMFNRGCPPDLRGVGGFPQLVGYWRPTADDVSPTIADLSASGHDGTMTNGPTIVDW